MPASEIWLNRIEEKLRSELEQGDMPFLGLYSNLFDEGARQYFHEKVLGDSSPIRTFIRGLSKWPATFATYLTVHVVEGYGQSGTGEVYPFIEQALGTSSSSLDQYRRVQLWTAYRKACISLGLSVVPEGSSARPYVDEYLRQAGVPIKYIADLTRKLENHAARLGLPSLDDPESITAWHEQLQGYLGPPISRTIPRAIETDETAYYTTTYLRVRGYESLEECLNEVEVAIYDALQSSEKSTYAKSAAIPELQWRNGSMGIQIPGGDGSEWFIDTVLDGIAAPVRLNVIAEEERQFVPLPDGFPLKVSVTGPRASFAFSAWEDGKDNRVLIVDRTGRLRARASLGDDEVRMLPGTYTLVTRWGLEEELGPLQVSGDPVIFESTVSIVSGQALVLKRGPASLAIVGKSVAAMEWRGQSRTGVLGRELFAGDVLSIGGAIPEEIASAAPGMFEVVISARDIEKRAEIPVELDEEQGFLIDLSEILREWPFGLFRVGAIIRRRDIPNRALARISGLVWNGLASTDGIHFRCQSKEALQQSNIDRGRCENIRFYEDGLTYREEGQRYFRTVFELSPTETVSFTWLVPGLFLSLVEFIGQNIEERPIPKESVIQVKPASRLALKIYSTLEGIVQLGEYRKVVSASSVSGMQMYLSPILEYVTAEDQTLKFVGESGVPINLLSIVTPHQFTSVQTSRTADTYKISIGVTDEIEELAIEAVEMVSGRRETIDLRVDVLDSATGRAMEKVWAASHGTLRVGLAGTRYIDIHWNVPDWETGAYVFRIRAKVARRWGELVNARGDVFVGSMIVSIGAEHPLVSIEDRPTAELLDIFRRSTEFLLECYAEESWADVKWIARLWNETAQRLDVAERQVILRLAILALRRAPEHSPASWAPISCVASTRLDVFAQSATLFRSLPSGELRGLGVLRSLGEFGPSDTDNFSRNDLFSPLAVLGFENGPLVAAGAADRLTGFSLERLAQTGLYTGDSERQRIRRREEWVPSAGLFLGARHYWWAVNRLESKFLAGLEGNEHRRGNSLRLASRLSATPWRAGLPATVSKLTDQMLSLGLMAQKSVDEESSQTEENISALVDLLSVTALACRYSVRQSEYLNDFLEHLAKAIDTDIDHLRLYLGYAIYIGIDVFLYYLLLWEFVLSRDYDEVNNVV
jgi:hypothetical protein